MKNKRVRICDIAEELGLSTATVSNVIHGKTKKVSAETVKQVQNLLEKRQYIPNMAGILLAQNNSRIIGLVINDHEKYEGHVLEDGFIAASINAITKEVDKSGYFLMIKATNDWKEISKYASMWNMVGLILIGFCEQDYQNLRDQIRIPFVIYDGLLTKGERLVNLALDNYDGGQKAGKYLKELGHEKVLCISDNDIHMDHERFIGLQSVLPLSDLMIIPMARQERIKFYCENITAIGEYSAIFAVSDYYAVDIMLFLQSMGKRVPEDISIIGFDDSLLASQVFPMLTTIQQNHRTRAKLALELLDKLRQEENLKSEYVLTTTLVERESTANYKKQ